MSVYEATLSLYEREAAPMPEKVGHAKKHCSLQVGKMNYTHLFCNFWAVSMHTEDWSVLS